MPFMEGTILKAHVLTRHSETAGEDEDLSPPLKNAIVLTQLHIIHPQLPMLDKQCYGVELSFESFLDEIHSADGAKILCAPTFSFSTCLVCYANIFPYANRLAAQALHDSRFFANCCCA